MAVPGGGTRGWPWHRQLLSRGGGLYARTILSLPIQDPTAGFICFSRHVLESIDLHTLATRGYGFQIELKYRCILAGFRVLEVPGHTATHIAYLAPGILFPGDTLFSAGCGRLLGGTAAQLHDSLGRLAALPGETAVYCTHEYTLANLAFAHAAEPENPEREAWESECRALREAGRPTLPSTIERERRVNPFLRTADPAVVEAIAAHSGERPATSEECFAALRAWKDVF